MSIRTERVASMLQREIAELLRLEFSSEIQSMVTVTGVRVTNDLGIAYIYISVYSDPDVDKEAAIDELKSFSGRIRKSLAKKIRHQLRGVPELKFFLDDTLNEAARLEELFGKINADAPPEDPIT